MTQAVIFVTRSDTSVEIHLSDTMPLELIDVCVYPTLRIAFIDVF